MRRVIPPVFASAMVVFLAVSYVSAEEPAVPKLDVISYRLDNGLKVALSRDPKAPQATVCVAYHVGSKNERAGLSGFAHFFEHMMFRGTKNVPNYDIPLQAGGGSPNAFTSNDMTVYFESIPASYLERALYMEAERMALLPSALDQNKFDTEREVVKNERRQRMENVPYGLASETISASVFPTGHPYSWSVIGSMKDLDSATLDDLRNFFWEFYHPGNATLTVVGNFDIDQTKTWIEKYFAPIPAGSAIPKVEAPNVKVVNRRLTQFDQVRFPRVYWTWPTVPDTHDDSAALDLLSSILSSGDASRLRQALVIHQPLATQVSAQSDTREIDGLFTIYATVAPKSSIKAVERELAAQLEKLRQSPPSNAELQRALAKHENGVLRALTSVANRAFMIGMGYAQYDNPHHYQKLITDYVKVTPADIQRVAKKYLTAEKFVLEVVPAKAGAEESAAVLAGPTTPNNRQIQPRLIDDPKRYARMPAPTQPPELSIPSIERHRLSNGLNVWIAKWDTLPLVSVQLVMPAGASLNSADQAGLASLTARCLDKGTSDMTATEFAEALDTLGVSLGINAGTQFSQLGFTVGTNRLDDTLKLVGKMLAEPRFDEADVKRERGLMLSPLARVRDNPGQIAGRVFPRLLYGRDHAFGRPSSGFTSTVSNLTAKQLKEFHRAHLLPGGSTLVVVGDVDTTRLLQQLEQNLAPWKGQSASQTVAPPKPTGNRGRIYLVDKPKAVQSVLLLGRRWKPRKDPTYFASQIGNRVIGGDFVSRINKNLRERNGYTYGVRTGFRFLKSESRWVLQTSVRGDVTAAALKEALGELEAAIGTKPLTDKEITVAQQAQLNSLPESFETPSSIAGAIFEIAIFDLPIDYLKQQFELLSSVKPDEVRSIMQELLPPDEQVILIVGDKDAVQRQLKQAGFENVTLIELEE